MSHVARNKSKLLARTRRIAGQLAAIERALIDDAECTAVLTQIAAVRGAVHGLLLEVLGDHLREHVAEEVNSEAREKEVDKVVSLLRSYMK